MTGEEKRRQLKEQYKRDLKLRKEFLEKAKKLRHLRSVNRALNEMSAGVQQDDSDEWINRLNQESAMTEARMDLSLEDAVEETQKLEKLAKLAEMEKFSAQQLVEQMKREMGLSPEAEEKAAEEGASSEQTEAQDANPPVEDPTDPPPPPTGKKTMGDF